MAGQAARADDVGRGSYEGRERVKLTQAHVRRAKGLIAQDGLTGRGLDLADTETKGLVLRITRRSGTFLLKHRAGTIRLGDMDALTVLAARMAAEKARVGVREGRSASALATDLEIFAEATKRGFSQEDALDAAFPDAIPQRSEVERRLVGPWQWGDLVELYLEHKLPRLKPRWAVQFERHLRRADEECLTHRAVISVSLEDLVGVRDRIMRERTPSAAADTVEAVKAAMDWAWKHHAPRAGLQRVEHPWWRERLTVDWASTPRERTPTLEELARTLIVAERHKALGGTAKETAPGMLSALWATVLSGQRAGALTGTLRATVRAWPERPGWEIWTWTSDEMKGKKPHAVPVPPEALAAIRRHRVDTESPFLFPSRKPGKRVTSVGMTQLFDRLRGKAKRGKDGAVTLRPEADLFAANGIAPWTPHDVRRTLGAYLDLERLGGAASAILAHRPPSAKGEPGQERELAQAITLKHYVHSQRLDLKAEGMQVWVGAVLEAYEAEHMRMVA